MQSEQRLRGFFSNWFARIQRLLILCFFWFEKFMAFYGEFYYSEWIGCLKRAPMNNSVVGENVKRWFDAFGMKYLSQGIATQYREKISKKCRKVNLETHLLKKKIDKIRKYLCEYVFNVE